MLAGCGFANPHRAQIHRKSTPCPKNIKRHFCQDLHQFYHGRQTIEQFFKESTGPFNAGKLPSQELCGNEAYLHLVTIAENCCVLFKKKFSLPIGKTALWKPLETG
ncbi:hypothetical protein FJZ31_34505 [Candidatus Poribacteria bacterium]|nr:hypothetical protein [Candidatus Poribacteria bacterium]